MPLELKKIRKCYGNKTVLESFELTLPDSGVVAMLGPSGCGKTTLLRLIAGLEKPDAGEVVLPSKGLHSRDAKISMVFQEDRLLPGLSAKGNVLAVLSAELTWEDKERQARKMLESCGLGEAVDKLPSELSGGMQRRVAVARAIAYGGDILLLDEPFKGLDSGTKSGMIRFVSSRIRPGALAILVTHDLEEAMQAANYILYMQGPPLEISSRE